MSTSSVRETMGTHIDSWERQQTGRQDRLAKIVGRHNNQCETRTVRVQELCESRGGRPGLSVLMSLTVSVDVKQHVLCQPIPEDMKLYIIIRRTDTDSGETRQTV